MSKDSSFWRTCRMAVLDFLFYLPGGGEASFRRNCLDFIEAGAGERILDLCCGKGEMTLPLARRGAAAEVVGVDMSPSHLQTARDKAGNLPVTFIEAQADALPFEAERFDKSIISLGLHHMDAQTRAKALGEAGRVLSPDGILYVIEYSLPRGGLWRMVALLIARLDSSKEALPMIRRASLAEDIRQAGFRISRQAVVCKGVIQLLEATLA
jgi:ubiquinone/menaquinone biosynthesis C-methylase UbiE